MAVLDLQKGIIYGPVNSRRLGRSLGINLLPTTYKLCSFDCLYCQYGRTQVRTLHPEAGDFPGVGEVLQAVEEALRKYRDIDYVTFSGNGEPTLHPHFAEIVVAVRSMLDELELKAKLAILSNSSTVHTPRVREILSYFDAPVMKLDAGDSRTMSGINRPAPGVSLEGVVEGLQGVPGVIIQSMLIDGRVNNIWGAPYEAWMAALAQIKPAQLQIYSADRPASEAYVERVRPLMLQRIASDVRERTGLQVQAYWR